MYVLLEFWQKIMVIPIMNPLSWFMIVTSHSLLLAEQAHYNVNKVGRRKKSLPL